MKAAILNFFEPNRWAPWTHWFHRIPSWSDRDGVKAGDDLAPEETPGARVGLVLSAGAAKGLAHIGVIQVLEEEGIPVHCIAGTSMGAYIGGLWAAGNDGTALQALACEIEKAADRLHLIDPVFPPRRGFIRGRKIEARLRRTLGDARIEELPRQLFIVATELESFRCRVFSQGDLVSAICASSAIPGILEPAELDGVEFVDGGICDPLPVGVLRPLVDVVIAVSVIPTVEELETSANLAAAMPVEHLLWWRRIGRWINRECNYFAKGNLLDILRKAAYGSQIRLIERSASEADIFIRVTAGDSNWHNYHDALDYIGQGRAAALKALPEIRAALKRGVNRPLRSPLPVHSAPTPETELCA